MTKQTATIERVGTVAANTSEVVFKISTPFLFVPGQYMTVTIPSLKELPEKEQWRDFSIASVPEDDAHVAIVFRNSESAFKKALLQNAPGTIVTIEGPKGIFVLKEDQDLPTVFLAGGVGISAFISTLRRLSTEKIPQSITLFYYNSVPERVVYRDEIEGFREVVDVNFIFGVMTDKEIGSYIASEGRDTLWYIAGPRGMVKTAREILMKFAVPEQNILSEEFAGYE